MVVSVLSMSLGRCFSLAFNLIPFQSHLDRHRVWFHAAVVPVALVKGHGWDRRRTILELFTRALIFSSNCTNSLVAFGLLWALWRGVEGPQTWISHSCLSGCSRSVYLVHLTPWRILVRPGKCCAVLCSLSVLFQANPSSRALKEIKWLMRIPVNYF